MSIIDTLVDVAKNNKDVVAFIEDKNGKTLKITYSELLEKAVKVAEYLKKQGIKQGDYVTVLITMSTDLYITLVALWYLGAIPVFFDVSASKEYVNKCSEIIKPAAIVGTKLTLLFSYTISSLRKCKKICILTNIKQTTTKFNNIKNLDEQGALVTFTSGSTGRPKTIVRTHKFLLEQYQIIKETMKYEKGQIDLGILPVFTLANLASGITTVIPNSKLSNMLKINAKNIVNQIETHKINTMTVSPAVLKQIADYAKENGVGLNSINRVYVGGGPVFPNMLKNLEGKEIKKRIVYGSSEAEPISELSWEDMLKLCDKMENGAGIPVGKVVEGVELKIINKDLGVLEQIESLESYTEKIGEITVTGNNVLKGYLGGYGDKENKIKVADKIWHRTGDCGYLDEDNILWLVGGKKSIIDKNDKNIFPFAIQCALNMKYEVNKSAVLKLDEKIILVLEKDDINTEIQEFSKKFEIDEIKVVERIPMDRRHGAKVDYARLLTLLDNQ